MSNRFYLLHIKQDRKQHKYQPSFETLVIIRRDRYSQIQPYIITIPISSPNIFKQAPRHRWMLQCLNTFRKWEKSTRRLNNSACLCSLSADVPPKNSKEHIASPQLSTNLWHHRLSGWWQINVKTIGMSILSWIGNPTTTHAT